MCEEHQLYEGLVSEVCIFKVVFKVIRKWLIIQENLMC